MAAARTDELPELLPGSGSTVLASTVATFVMVPAASTTTGTSMVTVCPASMWPIGQVSSEPATEQPAGTLTSVRPAGRSSVRTTPSAGPGPALNTVIVKVTSSPGDATPGATRLVTTRSATGGT